MPAPIEFYFDFSSPYGYIAAQKIDALAANHGRDVSWRPMLLGVAMKITGGVPLPQIPMKGEYARRDFERCARFHGVPFRLPSTFPIATITAVRAYYWLTATDPAAAKALARALYKAYFSADVDISTLDGVVSIAQGLGIDTGALSAGISAPGVKDRTRAAVDAAIARGVFGSPYFIVDGEPFWGADRLDQVDKWLATGGF